VDGIEALEGNVAAGFEGGPNAPDYNKQSLFHFAAAHPTAHVGDDTWKQHRADGMTGLHSILLNAVRSSHSIQAYVVNGLVTDPFNTTNLMSFANYAKGCGFDWQGIFNLGFDVVVQEAIWQQLEQNAELLGTSPGTFTPAWTSTAVDQFSAQLPGSTPVHLGHVEVTPFSLGSKVVITPSPAQFQQALIAALTRTAGSSVYSYSQMKTNGVNNAYASVLRSVYTSANPASLPDPA
jgi:hypothetical protein